MARPWPGSSHSLLASLAFIALIAAMTLPRHPALAAYLVSYWHYYGYWLAFRHGRVALDAFKAHVILLKSASLAALAAAYFSVAIDARSLVVVALGFLLNIVAARALGSDRTYYGHEIAGLPHQRTSAFPYTWIAHPMLAGNMAAFGGTLLNPNFRREWWPLAGIHVVLNLALLLMEMWVMPLRQAESPGNDQPARFQPAYFAAAAALGAALGAYASASGHRLAGSCIGAAMAAHAVIMHFSYTSPSAATRVGARIRQRGLHG